MDTPDHDPIEADRIQAFFDAISSGNLRRVKALLAEEPQLLFADLDDRASPAREALHSEHRDITDYLAREELRRLEEGTVPREHLYGAIHDLGDVAHAGTGYPLADQLRGVAEPVVVQFLRHEDPSLRYIALNVLGLHWKLRAHRETSASMMVEDPYDDDRGKVMEARGPLERASNEASAREDYGWSVRLGEQAARVWEDHVDWNFIAALERGQEP